MTRHVVIGGCGFLGRHLVRSLLRRGEDVTVVDRDAFPSEGDHLDPRCTICDLSAATSDQFDRIVADAEVVHHLAWSTIPQTANVDPLGDLQLNLGSTVKLLEALKRRGGGKMIFASSGGTVYGRLQVVPVPESHPMMPITAYGASKAAAEMYLSVFRDLYGVDARVARLANPFGAGQDPNKPQGVASTVAFRAVANQSIEVWGSGTAIRDFIHIGDAVAGLLAVSDASTASLVAPPVYNIGSGRGTSINEVIAIVERHIGRSIETLRRPDRAFDVPVSVLDIRKAQNELGWRPMLDIDAGIGRMISDLKENPGRRFSS